LFRPRQKAFNAVLWREDLPGGARYVDWIDAKGNDVAYFCDLCQWPPVAVGIASPEQAAKVIATADARIKQLEKEFGYPGYAGLSALWPVPESVVPYGGLKSFGTYMNGGSLLAQTYWEILARAGAGDREGAARRLRLFARRAAETSWAGENNANMLGQSANAKGVYGGGEPYLSDMVAVAAAAVHGVLGITPTWDRLEVTPKLPSDWSRAEAEILYKGRRHHITIEGSKVRVEPRERVIDLPLLWVVDANFRTGPGGLAKDSNVDLSDGGCVKLAKAKPPQAPAADYVGSGTYLSPPYDWTVPASLIDLTVAADLNGGRIEATIETSSDGFKTVAAQTHVTVKDGVSTYPLGALKGTAPGVRVRLDLAAAPGATQTPVVDGFRITGKAAEQ